MKTRIRIFTGPTPGSTEVSVNEWLDANPSAIFKDLKFSLNTDSHFAYYVLVLVYEVPEY